MRKNAKSANKTERHKFRQRLWALSLCMILAAGSFAGCGKEEHEDLSGEDPAIPGKGRYVETEVPLPEEWNSAKIRQIFRGDEQVHFLLQRDGEGGCTLEEWVLQEDDTLKEVTGEWLEGISFPCEGFEPLKLLQDKEGNQYLYACYAPEGELFYQGHLWRGTGKEATDITPSRWQEPVEGTEYYEYPEDITVTDVGTLIGQFYLSVDSYLAEDGSLLSGETVENGGLGCGSQYGLWIESVGDKVYQYTCDSRGSANGIEVRKVNTSDKVETIPFAQEKSGSVCFSVREDGAIVAAAPDGFFCCEAGDVRWTKLMEGDDSALGLTDLWCTGILALADGTVYGLYGSEHGDRLMRYRYDPDAVIQVTEELTLFTVKESYLLQQAAVLYHREHPEVLIKIEAAQTMIESYEKEANYQEIYQKLNTELLAGNGADILVMDHLNMESYASKGLLVDLEELIGPMEEDGILLKNITSGYRAEDGRRYAVPLQFAFTMVIGRGISAQEMSSMEALADTLSQMGESYMGPLTVEELVDHFYPYFVEEIVKDKTLDREALAVRLEQLRKIGDNCGILFNGRGKKERCYTIWDIASDAKLVFYQTSGFQEAMWPVSAVDYIEGEYTCFEEVYEPLLQIGINSSSPHRETAEDFLLFALSEAVQDSDYYEGFPVNMHSLEYLAAADRSSAEAYTAIEIGGGAVDEFHIKDFSKEEAARMVEMCKTVHVRKREDAKIREELIAALPGYLNGDQSLEETLDQIERGLNMYLAE